VAYPVGPTHPSNLKCLCRFHLPTKTLFVGQLFDSPVGRANICGSQGPTSCSQSLRLHYVF
jgi:hypothetical protein